MINLRRYPLSLSPCLALFVLAGCSSTSDSAKDTAVTPEAGGNVTTEEMQVRVEGANATREGDTLKIEYPVLKDKNDRIPDWAINPGLGGVIGSIGVANVKGLGTREQLEEARLSARLELARMLEARLQSVGRGELQENTGATGDGRSEQSTKNRLVIDRDIQDVVLAGTRQRAMWFDPENGECYVWLVLDGKLLEGVDHTVVENISVFVATAAVGTEYRPQRRKPEVPKVILQGPQQPETPAAPEAPVGPVEKLEGSLQPIKTVPIKNEAKKGAEK